MGAECRELALGVARINGGGDAIDARNTFGGDAKTSSTRVA